MPSHGTLNPGRPRLVLGAERRPSNSPLREPMNHAQREALTASAHARLLQNMEKYGNELTLKHATALRCIVQCFTELASREREGRWGFGLPAGGGKSQAIV